MSTTAAIKLVPKRKMGLLFQDDGANATISQISNITINEVKSSSNLTLDFIADGGVYKRTLGSELSGGIYKAASLTDDGIIEIATAAETTTGTDATRAVSPDGLAGSIFGTFKIACLLTNDTHISTGDGKVYIHIPQEANGMNLVRVQAGIYPVSTSGIPTYQINNVTDNQDMLSTKLSVDENEYTSETAGAAAVINTSYDDVATGDVLRIDKDVSGNNEAWDLIFLMFQLP